MANQICFRCFKIKGDYEVCPHCGYVESTKAEQAYQLSPGTILRERYIIGTSIGFGGFGITYKAFDTALGAVVAVKEFYPAGLVNRGEGEVKVGVFSGEKQEEFKRQLLRFLEEARNMAIFSKDKDIINVYDFFEENQTAYIIMEYVDAPLLKTRLKEKGSFPVEEAKAYMAAILDALSKIHAHGIIHKDISPDNIFLTGPDTIKIFDFGAAKFADTDSERTEAVVVKAGYTPPEQYRPTEQQDATMDIYAAGAVFYEMLTGEKPMDAPDRAVSDELKKPSEYGVSPDENLERAILKAMALEPKLRFQTAEQMKKAVLGQKKVGLPEEDLKRFRRRKRLLAVGSAAVILLLGGVVLLSQTVFSGRGRLDVSKIRAEELEVWLSAEAEDGGELSEALISGVQKEFPQLTVNVQVIAPGEYDQKLRQAIEEQRLPDVFCTDGVDASEYCAELSKLLNTIQTSSYLHLDRLEEACELPTAVQVGVVYLNEEKAGALPESLDIKDLAGWGETLCFTDEADVFAAFQNEEEPAACLAGDLSDLASVKEVTVEVIPPTDFTVVPIVKDGKLIGSLKNCYGVNQAVSENRSEAGMLILSLLLSDGMQSAFYMDNEDGIPLNREVFEQYQETKLTTYLSFLKNYDLGEMYLSDGGDVRQVIREEIGGNGV